MKKVVLRNLSTFFGIFVLSMFLLVSNTEAASEIELISENPESDSVIEMMHYDDIKDNPELIQFLEENNRADLLKLDDMNYSQQAQALKLSIFNTRTYPDGFDEILAKYGEERVNKTIEKYGMVYEQPTINTENIDVVTLSEMDEITGEPKSVTAWFITYQAQRSGFVVNFTKVGTSKLDTVSLSQKRYHNSSYNNWPMAAAGPLVTKTQVGSGVFNVWAQSMDKTTDYFIYQITVTENGTVWKASNSSETFEAGTKRSHQRYNFEVGIYGDSTFKALGGERHHLISADALKQIGKDPNKSPAIRMIYRDHRLTLNHGSSTAAVAYRAEEVSYLKAGKYEELISKNVLDFKKLTDPDVENGNLYNKYFNELLLTILGLEDYLGIVAWD